MLCALIAGVLLFVRAAQSNSAASAPTRTASSLLEVGAISGPAGQALLWLQLHGQGQSDVQWLQFSDETGMVDTFLQSQANALIVPVGTKLPQGVNVLGNVFTVAKGEQTGTFELVARSSDANSTVLQNLLRALRSQPTLNYLNTLNGYLVTSPS